MDRLLLVGDIDWCRKVYRKQTDYWLAMSTGCVVDYWYPCGHLFWVHEKLVCRPKKVEQVLVDHLFHLCKSPDYLCDLAALQLITPDY